jgi:hypothetical protein
MLRPPTEQQQGHNQRVESKNKVVIKVYLHYINLKSYNGLQVELIKWCTKIPSNFIALNLELILYYTSKYKNYIH